MNAPVIAAGSGSCFSVEPHSARMSSSMTSAAPNVNSRPYSGSLPYVRRNASSSTTPAAPTASGASTSAMP